MSDNYSTIMADNPTFSANQAIFLYHLRNNGHEQVHHILDDRRGGMCALGVGMEAFGIFRTWEDYKERFPEAEFFHFGSPHYYDPYEEIAKKLGLPKEHVIEVYHLNDEDMMTFGEIADVFETYLNSDRKHGPRTMHRMAKTADNKKRFAEVWEKAFAPVSALAQKRAELERQLEELDAELSATANEVVDTLHDEIDVRLNWYDDVSELSELSTDEAWDIFGDDFHEDD